MTTRSEAHRKLGRRSSIVLLAFIASTACRGRDTGSSPSEKPVSAVAKPAAATVAPSHETLGRPMAGAIEEVPVLDLLQLLSTSRKSGALELDAGASTGKIFLRNGEIYFATINENGDVDPKNAVLRMLSWETGTFHLDPAGATQVKNEIRESVAELIMDGAVYLDELRTLRRQLPPPRSPLAIPTPLSGKLRDLTTSELETFQLVLDHGNLQKVLYSFSGNEVEAARNVISLMNRDYVVIDPRQ